MGNIWILLVIAAAAMIIGSLLRGQKQPRQPTPQRPRNDYDLPPRQDYAPAQPLTPRRRVQPPPLPRGRIPKLEEAIPVARPAPPAAREPSKADGPAAIVQQKPQTASTVQVVAMLKNPKTLRAAMLLHEVLGPPVCRRRLPVPYAPNMPPR